MRQGLFSTALSRAVLYSAVVFGSSACGRSIDASSVTAESQNGCIGAATDIVAKLACIPGLTFTEVTDPTAGTPAGYRRFDMAFDQAENHFVDGGAHFTQKLVLLHRSETEPMLLQTSGYAIFGVRLSGIAQNFGMNQIQVEHRYFQDSMPTDHDWSNLDIVQSAADFHRVTVAFKQIYAAKWLNTGASKGGMTSVYHRRFYPQDLDGTLALVAPLSFSTDDRRFVDFVDNDGGEAYAACRARLIALQRTLLTRRSEVMNDVGGTYDQLGSADVAFEHAVIELPFAFFQYQDPHAADVGCDAIPAPDAPAGALKTYLSAVNGVQDGYSDEGMAGFVPYYYQAATQLGGPGANLQVIGDLLQHADTYTLDHYTPHGLPISYSNAAMYDVKNWVDTESEKIMFVYGELDPWSAGAFTPNLNPAADSYRYFVAGGNHGSSVFLLADAEKQAALAKIAHWIGKDVTEAGPGQVTLGSTLEDIEARYLAKHKTR